MVCRRIIAGRCMVAVEGTPRVFPRFRFCTLWFGFVWVSLVNFVLRGDGHISVFIVAGRRRMFRCLRPMSTRGGGPRFGVNIVSVYKVSG